MAAQLVLIGGASRSGKSSIAQALVGEFQNCLHLDLDDFVKPHNVLPTINDRIDWEQPQSINWHLLLEVIEQNESRQSLLIMEGIFAFCHQDLNRKATVKAYLTLERDTFFRRRKQETRWGTEPEWYLQHVWNAHLQWKNPYDTSIDVVGEANEQFVQQIISKLR